MRKIKLLELDVTTVKETFVSHSAGIWQKTLSVPEAVQDASPIVTIFSGTWDDLGIEPISVGSVRVDNTLLGRVDSIEELRLQDGSFYYDFSAQILYLALFNYDNAYYYRSYKIGETSGFSSDAQNQTINGQKFPVDSYIGSIYYEPRVTGDISASESIDDQKNGIFIFDDLSASLNNGDGKYDNIRDNVTGNEARILIADIAESKEEELATGYPFKEKADSGDFNVARLGIVEDVSYSNPNEPTITAIDRRSDWSQTISPNLLTVAEYPSLEDKNINKRKPLLIGQVNGSSCIQLEPDPGSSSATDFLICDTSIGNITTVDAIYFDGKISGADVDRFLTGGEYSVNTTTGVLTINNFDKGKAWFYGRVTDLVETVEITLFLLNEYANLAYITSNFNEKEIEAIRALDYRTHVYVDEKGEELRKVVEKLMMDIQVDFFQQGSVLTMRKGNEERASVEDITPTQISDNPAGWVNDRTDTVKTITVTYNQDWRTDENETYYDASKEQEAIDNNRKAIDKVFNTNLTDVLDVTEIYDAYYDRFTVPSRTVTVNRVFPIRAGLTDFVTFKVTRKRLDGDVDVFPRGLYKIVSKDPINNTAEIVYFADRPEPHYSQGVYAGPGSITIVNLDPQFFGGEPSYLYASYLYPSLPPYNETQIYVPTETGTVGVNPSYLNASYLYPSQLTPIITYEAETGTEKIVKTARSRRHAFGAPSGNLTPISFDGVPAFSRSAFRTPATVASSRALGIPVNSSGQKASITQQVGE